MSDRGLEKVQSVQDVWAQIQKAYPEANFLQSPVWGEVNRLIGHKVIGWANVENKAYCQMIIKNAKRGRYLEIPGGPLIDWQDKTARQEALIRIAEIAISEKCVFVRMRPQLRKTDANMKHLAELGARIAPMHLHAEHTVMIDLTKSEEDLLAGMRRQTRYEVRRADKLGIEVEWDNSEEMFQEFHQVQIETAIRQHFVPPDLKTLMAECMAFGRQARIYVSRTSDGEAIAYGLIFWDGAEAEYFEAASTELNQKLPGSYALLWRAMRDLKELGVKRFNLWGIAPPGQKNHRYAGVTTFKTGFGGEVVEFVPAHDFIVNKARYQLNLAVETLRKKKRHL